MANAASAHTWPELLLAALRARGAATAMRSKRFGLWQPISGDAMVARITAIAHGLRSLGLGTGDVAAIIGDNCSEWVLADLGIMQAGCVSASLDAFCDTAELMRLLNMTQARVLFVAGDDQLHKALSVRDRCPALRKIIIMHQQWDDGAGASDTLQLTELEANGAGAPSSLASDAPAAVIMTSGTTGPARGAILSHQALVKQVARAAAALQLNADDERLSLTPIHHVLERVVGIYSALLSGTIINFPESRETALANLVELQPTVVQLSPQLWARLRSGMRLAMAEATPFQRWACRTAFAKRSGLLDALVLKPIRARLGLGRARLCLSSGAPARDDVNTWFASLGRDLIDIYGLAEAGGAVRVGDATLDGATLTITEGEEIILQSDTLFAGYAGQPAQAARTWRTGDIGKPDATCAIGRLADLLHAGSRPIAPFAGERVLRQSPYIADAFLHLDRAGKIHARILMDSDSVVKYAQDRNIPFTHFLSLCRSDEIRALIGGIVAEGNRACPDLSIDGFTLIERALGPGDAETGPTLTLRRYLLRGDDPKSDEETSPPSRYETAQP